MTLVSCMVLAALVFSIGLACVIVHRNAVRVLMGIELMFNAVNINLVAINYFHPQPAGAHGVFLTGQLFAVFVITVAAAEAAVGLAIVLAVYRNLRTINVDQASTLKF
ncbi:MAG TPA: NADH-quinone oxidoreductase subunit NuoK [Armatimonadota bacterium]|nr:NADH-quinone oxidoreductase subunit NuoK [Armatimonadota bacterium]